MSYTLEFTPRAIADIEKLKKSGNKVILKKLQTLLAEISIHPETGTGKREMLKHEFAGYWSRRVNKEHRIVYSIDNSKIKVVVISVKGHYT